MERMNIAVFCSGNGSNFQAIADNLKGGQARARIAIMVCDNPQAYALQRAQKEGVKVLLVERKNFKSKTEYERAIIQALEKESIALICLAGYMRLVGAELIQRYQHKIINIHPALLPAFKGTNGIKDALEYGVKMAGVSVHFVDDQMDHGPIISQRAVEIKEDDTLDSLAERIHQLEHLLYPQAVRLFVEGKLKIVGRKVKISV